ncbi:arsenate reductase (glutaredoxin) [Aestuariicoccus sp. MJ-SS9]|uniref:arsenate reductase (glutaredoxin) n=1 Tax=Aestuariicoccus sp. MJ-SS9 TaxID=3079855 RepID=UPI002914B6A0|nr:arsenate reductase (glutaredoxin) [Aestuariicoccus sp. MJ-SS9]MDU8910376.1 arsenate reductase (glutaredoxin) [Aestuariicoccus sp. MJ-SS9]
MAINFWHNPRCSKSRQALALLEEAGAEIALRRYLDDPPSEEELRAVLALLGRPAIDIVRTEEPEFKAQGLTKDSPEDTLIAALAATPRLIERPIAFTPDAAALGRPPEAVLDLLKD